MPRATRKTSSRLGRSRESKVSPRPQGREAEELMELAVDAAQSRHLPGFLERFAERATRMLNAKWGGVMVFRGRETDLYQSASGEKALDAAHRGALVRSAHEERCQIEARILDPDQALAGLSDNSSAAVIFV